MADKKKVAPTVTVGIPYHNNSNPGHLKEAIESITNQTLKPTELHLIQDGQVGEELSTLVQTYLDSENNIKKINIPENKGLPYALNCSILQCNTKYYARMDDDDISLPKRIEKQIAYMEQNPEIYILGSWALEFKGEYIEDGPTFLRKVPLVEKKIQRFFHYRSPFIHPSVVYRTEVFAKIGLYNSLYKSSQDIKLWARVFKLGVRVANLPEPLIYYRATNLENKRTDLQSVLRIAKALFSYNTLSPYLNLLKVLSIGFRLLPKGLKKWGYKHLRSVKIKKNDNNQKDKSNRQALTGQNLQKRRGTSDPEKIHPD